MSLLHDDTGQPIGHWYAADDGATVATDFDGNIIGAVDAQGQVIDHTAYTVQAEPSAFERVLDDRVAGLERQETLNALRQHEIETAQADEDLELLRAAGDAAEQITSLEAQLGRSLTAAESQRVIDRLRSWHDVGREMDVAAAVEQLEAEGQPLLDLSSQAGRVDYATQLAREQEDVTAGREPGEPRSRESYDLADRDQRQAWMADMAGGADVEGREFDSSVLDEQFPDVEAT